MSDSTIPGYKVLKKVAKGGMASVFIAIQMSVGRTIALKILSKKLCEDSSFSRLFLQEANCGVLNHPNIITIYEAGETDSHLYIAMEYLQGGDLKQKIKAGLSQEETIDIITKLSEALAYAHSKGFIHRDIKPGNVLFNEIKQPILADFGIARAISFNDQTIIDGMMMGTPHYTSPEQASSSEVDHRTDLYSLGVVYYEMLTGSKPFISDTPFALIYKHLEEPPPQLDSEFEEHQPIIHKLMSKKPDDRYASAFDLIEDLAKLSRSKNEQAAIRSARMRTYKSISLFVALVLVLSVIVSDKLSNYREKQFSNLKTFAARTTMLTKDFLNELDEKRSIVEKQEEEIHILKAQINKNNVIDRHLYKAANYIKNSQYIMPKDASALYEYTLVLSIDPDNVQAQSGISVITEHYYQLAKNEVSKRTYFEALDKIDSGLIANPNSEKLAQLRISIIARMSISDKRMQLENELLLAKNLMKKGQHDLALEKLEFLQTISKKNQRIMSLISIAQNHQKEEME
ncbi:MAG: serine/threonine protein kinase [Gammaproteobacteria bacterium]|nr:serine/threonine protein kinase [Gammaproteobacteria bacterium]